MLAGGKHAAFFDACLEAACSSTMHHRLGAVVVRKGAIIGRGRNANIRPPSVSTDDLPPSSSAGASSSSPLSILPFSVHAEVSALRSCLHYNARTSLSRLPPYCIPSSTATLSSSSSSHVPHLRHRHKRRAHLSPASILSNTTLYVGRYNNFDRPMNAQPCWRCVQSMREYGVKKVLWTTGAKGVDEPGWDERKVEDLWDEIINLEDLKSSGYLTGTEEVLCRRHEQAKAARD